MNAPTPAIFLDRDGVIIENRAEYVRTWADVEFFPQALQALAAVRHLPYKIIVVTNQSAVGQGILTLEKAQRLNQQVVEVVRQHNGRIDAIYMCPHRSSDGCTCRKPKPGMLLQAAQEHTLDLSRSVMIGDALTDLAAGRAAGVQQAILLLTGRGQAQSQLPETAEYLPFPIYPDLQTVFNTLLLAK